MTLLRKTLGRDLGLGLGLFGLGGGDTADKDEQDDKLERLDVDSWLTEDNCVAVGSGGNGLLDL